VVFNVSFVAAAMNNPGEGHTAGPLPAPGGFHLYHVKQRLAAELDEATAALVRAELLSAWLGERLADVSLDLTWLGGPDESG
jgi:hypothetical protein